MNSNATTEANGNNPFWVKDTGNQIILRNDLFLSYFNSISFFGFTSSNIGNWIHISIVKNGTNVKIFRNVNKISDRDIGTGLIDLSSSILGNSQNYFFNGLIDEIVIYDKVLTLDEISQLYNTGSGVSVSCGPPCVQDCTGLSCGPDPVCGQSCGSCNATSTCSSGVCVPQVSNCGNGNIESGEECDGTDLAPYTSDCSTHPSYTGGTLACYPQGHAQECTLDTTACTSIPIGNIYYVSSTGTATWSQCTSIVTPCSLNTANSNAVAGDTIYLRGGTYSSGGYINPSNSGTSNTQRITYQNYQTEVVIIQNANYGINLDSKSYITVQGIDFTSNTNNLYIQNSANYNIIAYCTFTNSDVANWDSSVINGNSQYNWIHHSQFSKGGECTVGGVDFGQVLDIGIEGSYTDLTRYNLIEDNVFFHGGHHIMGLHASYNIIRNNYFHNEVWSRSRGNRNIYLNGRDGVTGNNLIEGNRFGYAARPCDDFTVGSVAISTPNNIFRYNELYHHNAYGLGTYSYNGYSNAEYNNIYSNTIFNSGYDIYPGYEGGSEDTAITFMHSSNTGNEIKNNLYFSNYQVHTGYTPAQTFANNWNGDVQGDPLFVDASTIPPTDKTDSTIPNLELQSNSPAINQGGELTTIAVADTGTGTLLIVADASYFQDGTWAPTGTVQADWIAVGTVDNTVQITSISGNTITLANTISRNDGDSVWLYKKSDGEQVLYGDAPDAGANEYVEITQPPTGNITYATSCELVDVQNAITSANPEDTIMVPAGDCTWTQTLTITKGINLIGAGIGNTTIRGNNRGEFNSLINYNPIIGSQVFRVSGFTFDITEQNAIHCKAYSEPTTGTIRIDHNRFTNSNIARSAILNQGCFGVIDNNVFDNLWYPLGVGEAISPGDGAWAAYSDAFHGTVENIYVEDNIFDTSSGVITDCDQGGRYAFRYNTITQSTTSWPLFDTHEWGTTGYGCMGAEIYGNTATQPEFFLSDQGSGRVIAHHNIMPDGWYKLYSDGARGCPPNIPYLTRQMPNNNYFFQSRFTLTGTMMPALISTIVCNDIWIEDLTFWDDNANCQAPNICTDLTTGIGCGTLANRPTTCTTGVGYWATDQSCTDLTGMVGANPITPIDGILYKCTSTNTWTEWYTPLEYPHPLRTGNTLPVPTCNDVDKDGYGNPASNDCTYPDLDCNDNDAEINPNAIETCNQIDEDCDGSLKCHDADSDGSGCIEDMELDAYVLRWFASSQDVSMSQLISAIRVWKAGC